MSQQVSLEILEPRGVLQNPKREGLFAPRLTDLNGKTIALMGINIPYFHSSSEPFFEAVDRKLRERYPEVKILRMNSFGTPIDPPEKALEVAAKCDAWLEGVKDAHTQGRHDAGVCMERAGRPGVSICVDVLRRQKEAAQDLYGMPKVRIVDLPSTDYNAAKDNPELMDRVAEGCIDEIIDALTRPLTEEEKRSFDLEADQSPKTFTGANYSEAYEKFMEYCMDGHIGDGLALAPPTREAVEWMLTGTTYPRDRVIGLVEPKLGQATVEKIAIASVMAGAKPEWLPVIIAIMETLTDPGFNQFHIVNEILPAIFLSGPIVKELGLNTKVGYLAPGTRANSAIGRAVLMCMITIGWRDMTIYASPGGPGRPAAYANILVPENLEDSPWESWAESNGFGPEDSVVTACEFLTEARGPAEIVGYPSFEDKLGALTKLFGRKGSLFGGSLPRFADGVRLMLVLHPTMARQLADRGFTKESLVKYLYDRNVIDYDAMTEEQRSALREELTLENRLGRAALRPEDVKPGLHLEPFSKPEHLMVIVSGSGSGQTQVYYTSSGSTAGLAEGIGKSQPWMTKVIRGAALTKYGR
ncbi:MAG: hypothetical protein J5633_08015 [Oscillospiraceae bacterium]|nr:hypothetical protein [Oscillospiraceae bacterium]